MVGQQVDRFGSKTILQSGNALQAASFVLYPFVDQVWSVALVVSASVIGRTAFWGSYSPMVTVISPPGEREKWFGFLGALRNAGFAVGGVVAGAALTVDATWLYYTVALLNAASYALSFVLLAGVSAHDTRSVGHADPAEVVGGWGTVLRDRGYRWLVGEQLLLRDGLGRPQRRDPRVRRGDARPARLGVGRGVRDQHPADRRRPGPGRGPDDRRGAVADRRARAASSRARRSWCCSALEPLGVAAAVVVVLVGAVVYTLGELVSGPVLATLAAESPPAALRGRYLATYQLSWNVATGVAPLLYAWLLDLGSLPAWLGMAAIALAGAAMTVPMRRRLDHAGRVVTNRAEEVPA